jgi:16S rRNA (guanine(966)-N(2))-methyltransferase RsmD
MRITGGDLKGRTINFPAGIKERPTSDFLRETLFNLLPPVEGKNFIDLFAGSGGVGLEAASRCAGHVYLIEKGKKLAGVIRKNIKSLALDEKCFVINFDVETALKDLAKKNHRSDIVFADPPYNRNMVSSTLACLGRYQVLDEKGVIVIQHSVKENYQEFLPENIYQVKQRKYGENMITFFTGEWK